MISLWEREIIIILSKQEENSKKKKKKFKKMNKKNTHTHRQKFSFNSFFLSEYKEIEIWKRDWEKKKRKRKGKNKRKQKRTDENKEDDVLIKKIIYR